MFFVFCFKLLVIDRNRDLGDCSQIFCKLLVIITTGMFYPLTFLYSLFFVKNPSSLVGEERLWTFEDTNWDESGCFVTALAFNISKFYFNFSSYQFAINY
jgi:hypothetical protein